MNEASTVSAASPATAAATAADVYLALARDLDFWDGALDDALFALVRSTADSTQSERCGLWRLDGTADAPVLRAITLHDAARPDKRSGVDIECRACPAYLAALEGSRLVDAADAMQDTRTRQLAVGYLDVYGIGAMLDVTLRRSGRLWGVLCVEHVGPPRLWSEDDRRLVTSMADLAQQRLAHEDLKRSESAYRTLFATAANGILVLDEGRYVDLNPAAERLFGCPRARLLGSSITDWSPALQADGTPSHEGAAAHLAAALRDGACAFDWRHVRADGTGFDAEVALTAIRLGGGTRVLAEVRDVSERVRALAQVAAYSETLAEHNRRLQALHRLGTRLQGSRNIGDICSEIVQAADAVTTCDFIAVMLLGADGAELHTVAARGLSASIVDGNMKRFGMQGLVGEVLRSGAIHHVPDFADDRRALPDVREGLVDAGVRSFTVVPLGNVDAPVGALGLGWRDAREALDEATLEIFDTMGKTVTLALANTRHLAGLDHQAHHDSLTGLPNRMLLHRDYAQRVGTTGEAALFLLDLDRFKEVNDTLGHHVGDRLLAQLAARLVEAADAGALACRLGGDEFAVLVPGITDVATAVAHGERLRAKLAAPLAIDGMVLQVDASVGVAIAPAHGRDSHELLRAADVSMYEAKRHGGAVVPYAQSLDQHSPERLVLIGDLDRAIRARELELHFQPKLALADGRLVGFEGLLRWRHPQRGMLMPGEFVPLAEVGSAIHALTDLVLDLALSAQARWRELGHELRVAVNLSPRNLADESIVERVGAALAHHDAPPTALELELTETALLHDPERAARLLGRLGELGVGITIDDFGTGYSSLNHLRRLPIGTLKIDASFIAAMRSSATDAVIVRSTVALAHNLGLGVVAEGIEDHATWDALAAIGCDQGQGYLIGAAQSAEDVEWCLLTGKAWMPDG
jgi:diguanylate cyclase (GGDEF)-like protein/PAS domain S-box-containing protein